MFTQIYKVKTHEMMHPFEYYETFNKFFTRQVKPRVIGAGIVSPADSKILSISRITKDECLLVKKVTYSVCHLLKGVKGDMHFNKHHKESSMWSCIFYLAPGDYHRYHSPVDFVAHSRLHIPGKLAPVKESSLKNVRNTTSY